MWWGVYSRVKPGNFPNYSFNNGCFETTPPGAVWMLERSGCVHFFVNNLISRSQLNSGVEMDENTLHHNNIPGIVIVVAFMPLLTESAYRYILIV